MSVQRILVTGGAGFIGSSLCERLVQQGHTVVALDSMFRGDEANLDEIIGEQNFSLYAGDVRDVDDLDACVEAMGGLDAVLARGADAYEQGDYRWAAELFNKAVFA